MNIKIDKSDYQSFVDEEEDLCQQPEINNPISKPKTKKKKKLMIGIVSCVIISFVIGLVLAVSGVGVTLAFLFSTKFHSGSFSKSDVEENLENCAEFSHEYAGCFDATIEEFKNLTLVEFFPEEKNNAESCLQKVIEEATEDQKKKMRSFGIIGGKCVLIEGGNKPPRPPKEEEGKGEEEGEKRERKQQHRRSHKNEREEEGNEHRRPRRPRRPRFPKEEKVDDEKCSVQCVSEDCPEETEENEHPKCEVGTCGADSSDYISMYSIRCPPGERDCEEHHQVYEGCFDAQSEKFKNLTLVEFEVEIADSAKSCLSQIEEEATEEQKEHLRVFGIIDGKCVLVIPPKRPEHGEGKRERHERREERPERPEHEEGERPERPEHEEGERPERPEHEEGERPERPERREERPERPEHEEGERPERPEHEEGERPERPEHEEGERPERPEHEEGERPERPEHEEGERPERPEREERRRGRNQKGGKRQNQSDENDSTKERKEKKRPERPERPGKLDDSKCPIECTDECSTDDKEHPCKKGTCGSETNEVISIYDIKCLKKKE